MTAVETVNHEDGKGLIFPIKITRYVESPSSRPGTEIFMPESRDLETVVYDFGQATCKVQHWNPVADDGPPDLPVGKKPWFRSLDFQVICEYGYQYEMFAGVQRKSGTGHWRWFVSAYKHPYKPPIEYCEDFFDDIHQSPREWQRPALSDGIQLMCARLLANVERYPTLLFNPHGWGHAGTPRHSGFVHGIEAALHGHLLEDWT